ncbi:hypothetical protein A1Q1_04413 [Trichosporon asahii var. asahii CBS 2479]|uniref:NADH dehydrogenase [ubiquinone] 1 alpha subcomplex subunit n=1 Tax=Trichosporon asahii var. asahii (strain ATCC 90039 / CBS 2479 / JCM 2466 / KCTC 7840 / NBRC 103889/ NCYC 2677 / UAMH 7654) TaxID=1186058 RepID=J6EVM7_TRIAS|nr:hypothetical protein A1Q1_04413 [Trichosporon asahii var. asahii CBS 2479]EJT46862.1 hypothetical protein A1Q1_04413 [Trichosporon asahii var. asahii CBS 2479]
MLELTDRTIGDEKLGTKECLREGCRDYMRATMYASERAFWNSSQESLEVGVGDRGSAGTVGEDEFGNRYYENYNPREEQPGRQRWVDLVQYDFNATQIPRPWASWLTQIRLDPPTKDEVVLKSQQPWQVKWNETLTGTRGRFITYNTARPKVTAWEPQVKARGQ